jgi:mannose-6-phosphate isomerase-like protein (cupin superfamily)
MTLGEKTFPIKGGEAVDIPVTFAHRIANTGETNIIFIEVQTGSYFGEDDIERMEDDFGRV